MSTVEKPEKQRRSGGRVILIISLAANLFLVGLLAGGWASGFRVRGPIASNFMMQSLAPDLHIRQLAHQLPDATRMKLRETMASTRAHNRTIIHDVRQSRHAIFQALRAEPFDATRLDGAFKASRQADLARRELSHQVLLNFLTSLDEQEKAFVVRMVGTTLERAQEFGRPGRPQSREGLRRLDMRSDELPGQQESDAPDEEEK